MEGGKREAAEVRVSESSEELSKALAEYVVQISDAAIRERGTFALALSGGNLAQLLRNLKRPEYLQTVHWCKWHVFWAVENFVPKTHPDCFYKRTKEDLLCKLPIPSTHVNAVTQGDSAESTAENYQFWIRQLVKNRTVEVSPSSDCPKFDLILLMLGSDGHVASLYPNHSVLEEESLWVAPVLDRYVSVSFTLPVINSAANVAIVASGSAVSGALASALGDSLSRGSHPAQLVSPRDGNLVWFADASAASALRGKDPASSSSSDDYLIS